MKALTRLLCLILLLQAGSAFAQDDFGSDPEACKMNISLYQENFNAKNYRDAYNYWSKILQICPKWKKSIYQNGATILGNLIQEEKDTARRRHLIDTLYLVYDMRAENFGEKSLVLGMKAQAQMIYDAEKCEAAFETARQAVEEGGDKSSPEALSTYYQAMNCLYGKEKMSKEQMLTDYVKINGIIEKRLANPQLKETERPYLEQAREVVNNIFFRIADCSDIGKIVDKMVQEKPDDVELKGRLLKVLNAKECTDEKVYRPLAEAVHKQNPTAESAFSLAMMLVKQNDMSGALKYMKEAVDLCGDCPDRMRYLVKAGQIASAAGSNSQARSFANQILQSDPKNGEALILIGNSILAYSTSCEPPDQWGVYWLAYDHYQRAKAADPAVAEKASERMAICSSRFPATQEAFFYQLTDGQSFQVTCGGLNESTTVRTKK